MRTDSAVYQPALFPDELRRAADEVWEGLCGVDRQLLNARQASEALVRSGFEGPAANASNATLNAYAAELETQRADLERVRAILQVAALAHACLDAVAEVAIRAGHHQLIQWLNRRSQALDRETADALRTNVPLHTIDGLFAHPDDSLEQVHARHAATVPAATLQTVEASGGTILEAGPASTTVMIGNTVAPERVITMVAGTHTGKPEDLGGELDKAQRIAARTGASVVVWQGYGPPANIPDAGAQINAVRGADNLAQFQAALESRFPSAQKTIVAHSYGTLVPTLAAAEHGLLVDDLWLLGSAGVAGGSVDDLALAGPDSAVFVVDSPDDIILTLRSGPDAALGASPSSPSYGATPIEGVTGSHTDYFTDPAFLSALAQEGGQYGRF